MNLLVLLYWGFDLLHSSHSNGFGLIANTIIVLKEKSMTDSDQGLVSVCMFYIEIDKAGFTHL